VAFEVVRPGGRFCPFGMASGTFAQVSDDEAARLEVRVRRGTGLTPEAMVELSTAALTEAAAGRLIAQTFPLERAADAHAAIEARETIGKTLLLVGS
jgi:NADPH:quinone reductase